MTYFFFNVRKVILFFILRGVALLTYLCVSNAPLFAITTLAVENYRESTIDTSTSTHLKMCDGLIIDLTLFRYLPRVSFLHVL